MQWSYVTACVLVQGACENQECTNNQPATLGLYMQRFWTRALWFPHLHYSNTRCFMLFFAMERFKQKKKSTWLWEGLIQRSRWLDIIVACSIPHSQKTCLQKSNLTSYCTESQQVREANKSVEKCMYKQSNLSIWMVAMEAAGCQAPVGCYGNAWHQNDVSDNRY